MLTDPETGVASGLPEAAMCVQDIDAQCVLQFTLIHAAGCALHRLASRVIHRLELYQCFSFCAVRGSEAMTTMAAPARNDSWDSLLTVRKKRDEDNRVGAAEIRSTAL